MGFLIVLLTVVMVLDCLVLMFLVLIQLPKKEAGAGLAFGGSATDALFGAGSGNVLTKITKYSAGTFFVLAVVLSVLQSHFHTRTARQFEENLSQPIPSATHISRPASPTTAPSTAPSVSPAGTNLLLPAVEATNMPAVSNPPASSVTPTPSPSTNK